MTNSVSELASTSKADLVGVADNLKADFDEDTAVIDTIVTGVILDEKTVERTFVQEVKKTQKSLDRSLKQIESGSKTVAKGFKVGTKNAVTTAIPDAEESFSTASTNQSNELQTLFGDDRGAKQVIKQIAKAAKQVKKTGRKVARNFMKYSDVVSKTMVSSIKKSVQQQKVDTKTDLKSIEETAKGLVVEVGHFPAISDASFSYGDLTTAGKTMTVTVTRLADSATAQCTLAPATVNTLIDSNTKCEYTPFDEMMYDYLCTMTPVSVRGSVLDCTDLLYRPSTSCFGSWK